MIQYKVSVIAFFPLRPANAISLIHDILFSVFSVTTKHIEYSLECTVLRVALTYQNNSAGMVNKHVKVQGNEEEKVQSEKDSHSKK